MPKPKRQYDALEFCADASVCEPLVLQRELHVQPAVRQLRGHRELRRDSDADDRTRRRRRRSSRAATYSARAAMRTGPGTSTSCCGTPTATTMCWVGSRPIVRMSSSSTGRISCRSARRSAPSSTAAAARRSAPMSTRSNQIPVFVNGRGDMGRTPILTQTDLLVSHELRLRGQPEAALRAQCAECLQPEDRDAHLQLPESRAPALPRQASAINLARNRSDEGLRLQRAASRPTATAPTPTIRATARRISSRLARRDSSA